MATVDQAVFLPSLAGESVFSQADLRSILLHPIVLSRQGDFLGRPATQVYASDSGVVKLRTDFVFQAKDVLRRTAAAREKDLQLAVYHPQKTWFHFVLDGKPTIGSITPRLKPLNTIFAALVHQGEPALTQLFHQWFRAYFSVAKNHSLRLDEGLSNFGLDEAQNLFYLDDDTYNWDDYTSLAQMLAVWVRQNAAIDSAVCRVIASALVSELITTFCSPHQLTVLYGQLRALDGCSPRERALLGIILEILGESIKAKKAGNSVGNSAANTASVNQHETPSAVVSQGLSQSIENEPSVKATGVSQPLASVSFAMESPTHSLALLSQPMAIIADIHANQAALLAVLADIDRQGIRQLLVLGDIVGYGPEPNECVALLNARQATVIQGNHDYAAASGDLQRGFSKLARWAIEWTQTVLSAQAQNYLHNLPPIIDAGEWLAVHGAPIDKQYFYAYVYQMTYQDNLQWLADNQKRFAFHGHSHVQSVYGRSGHNDELYPGPEISLADLKHALICPGSVGQPRGGDWRAEYAVLYPQTNAESPTNAPALRFYKLEYDLEKTLTKMQEFNFPSALINRYREGK